MIAELARLKAIEIIAAISDPMEAFADRNMLETVIRNLLTNALKFTREGGRITISALEIENNFISISVKDTGVGMTNEMQSNLFRIDAKVKRPGTKGEHRTGLGLPLCKGFVEKHGGKIRVESEQNKGTVFSFTIPWSGERIINVAEEVVKVRDAKSQTHDLQIVNAEDDEISARLISIIVKGFSKQIYRVRTGLESVEICRKNPDIDLVLMDIAMPVMAGYEATRQIRMFNQKVIIIAQTTFVLSGDKEKAFAARCNDYIEKPLTQIAL